MTFNAMSQWWTGWLYPIRLTFRRLPSVASGQYYEDHDGVFNRAGSTLAVPLLPSKWGPPQNSFRILRKSRIRRFDVLLLISCITRLGDKFGGTLSNRCTCSGRT